MNLVSGVELNFSGPELSLRPEATYLLIAKAQTKQQYTTTVSILVSWHTVLLNESHSRADCRIFDEHT